MSHEKPTDSIQEAEQPAPARAEAAAPLPADAAQAAAPQTQQPAVDQVLDDLTEPTDEAALYHLLSVC
jgi:hypothetical protein